MKELSTVPEYSVVESEKIAPTEKAPLYSNRNYFAVVADLGLLVQELTISVDILGRIRDSAQELAQSLEAQR